MENTETEVFLSDIHTEITDKVADNESYVSRFQFKVSKPSCENDNKDIYEYDDDGDLVIDRESFEVIEIEHFMATPLKKVGLQVWKGALFLADFILHNGEAFQEETVLELGAGPGLCSLVAARYAKSVIATDYDDNILKLLNRNTVRNKSIIKGNITVEIMDWTKHESNWELTEEMLKLLEKVSIILAADVIYSDELTDAFFQTLEKLIKISPIKVIYLSMEKRLNFTLEDLDISCPAYNHFKSIVSSEKWREIVTREDTNFSQYFDYERVPQLELWTIKPQNITLNI